MKLALISVLFLMTSCSYIPAYMQMTDDGKDIKIDIQKKEKPALAPAATPGPAKAGFPKNDLRSCCRLFHFPF